MSNTPEITAPKRYLFFAGSVFYRSVINRRGDAM